MYTFKNGSAGLSSLKSPRSPRAATKRISCGWGGSRSPRLGGKTTRDPLREKGGVGVVAREPARGAGKGEFVAEKKESTS